MTQCVSDIWNIICVYDGWACSFKVYMFRWEGLDPIREGYLFDPATKGRFIHNVAFHTIEQHYSNWNDFYILEQEQKPTIKMGVLDWFRGNPTVIRVMFTGWEGERWVRADGGGDKGQVEAAPTLVPSPSWVRPSYLTQQTLNLDWKTLI